MAGSSAYYGRNYYNNSNYKPMSSSTGSGLTMSNTTTGRSATGVNNLISEMNTRIDTVINALEGQEYKDLVNVTNQNWSGGSKDAFMADLANKIQLVKNDLGTLKKTIETDLIEDKDDFIKRDAQAYEAK